MDNIYNLGTAQWRAWLTFWINKLRLGLGLIDERVSQLENKDAGLFEASSEDGFIFKNSSGSTVFGIDNDGFQLPQYDDLMPGMGWIDAAGGSAPDVVPHTIAGVSVNFKSFDGGNTTEAMTNAFEITHSIDIDALNREVNPIMAEIHTHGMPSTAVGGVVKINYDLVYQPVDSAPISLAPLSNLITIEAGQQYWHKLGGVEIPKPSSGYSIGDHIIVRYYRVPTDAQDTYPGD